MHRERVLCQVGYSMIVRYLRFLVSGVNVVSNGDGSNVLVLIHPVIFPIEECMAIHGDVSETRRRKSRRKCLYCTCSWKLLASHVGEGEEDGPGEQT